PVSQSASQPVSQSASQPVSQSASQPVSQSASQPVSQSARKLYIVLYPSVEELTNPDQHYSFFKQALLGAAQGTAAQFLEVRNNPDWHAGLYRDGIHPSPEGYRVLAHILAKTIGKTRATSTRQ
ncbi:MAG: hypothetical protein LBU39_05250, partial [Desulfobulbaceae bacterium]|nr:hypothetical protein [Desulfobulbaceae bacterium]